ncbi:MAG: hypothetical protein Q9195_006889 [Heterodermia aff. obscurata]
MSRQSPLYLGFDLSTQQLKGVAIDSGLKVVHEAKFEFDADSRGYGTTKGVLTNEAENEVYAPVAAFLQALDGVLLKLQHHGIDFSRVRCISGAGMQHGSVYWSEAGEQALSNLDEEQGLEGQLGHAFSHPYSPNWQDASTQKECDTFDSYLGDELKLAVNTGSKAHHRFTGPQILRFRQKFPKKYEQTSRISLVSSFLASLFLGKIAPFDISDVCGMNLWDVKTGIWNEELLTLAGGSSDTANLRNKLGHVPEDGGCSLGNVSSYFVERYGFHPSCTIAPFTGDNPSTLLALPLQPLDAIVSLGTSTTFLMSTPHYKPDPSVHFMNHPTTPGLYMFMLCYKNGGLARENVRNSLALATTEGSEGIPWSVFDETASSSPSMGQQREGSPIKMGLYFPRPEIVPNVRAGTWRFTYDPTSRTLSPDDGAWNLPADDVRAIIESQLLSLRLRSEDLVEPPQDKSLPAQPRRIYLVGGGSKNLAIAKIAGEVLGGVEGVYRLDVGDNACALGAAYKAVWAAERREGETFEQLIGSRWKEGNFAKRIADGYQRGVFERYAKGVEGLAAAEREILKSEGNKK